MKAIRMHDYGGPDQLIFEDIPNPQPRDNEVLIKVKAAGVNPVDYKIGGGMRKNVFPIQLPWIPGKDFSGIVEGLGKNVKGFKIGQEVFGCASGAYAEYLVAPWDSIVEKPKNLNFIEAAAIPVAGLTAWQCLFDHGHLQKGQTVLIHGGAGGVGSMAVQLAHIKGAKVFTTGSVQNEQFLKSIGADQFIDYKKTPFETEIKNVDLVLDLIGGDTQKRSFQVIREGGYLISTLEAPSEEELARHKIHGNSMRMQLNRSSFEGLLKVIEDNQLKIFVKKSYPLAKAREAWEQIMTGHTQGKIVLEVG